MGLSAARKYLKQAIEEKGALIGTYQHAALYFLDIAKDAVDTFKPYKTKSHRNRDLFKFFHGLDKLVRGIATTILYPFEFIYLIFFRPTPRELKARANHILNLFFSLCEKMIAGTSLTILGVTQIITSPIILMRMPLRDYLSKGTTPQYFEDRKSIKLLVEQADEIMKDPALAGSVGKMRQILGEVQRKKYSLLFDKDRNSYSFNDYDDNYRNHKITVGENKYNKKDFCCFFVPKDLKDSDPILQPTHTRNKEQIAQIISEINYLRVPKHPYYSSRR